MRNKIKKIKCVINLKHQLLTKLENMNYFKTILFTATAVLFFSFIGIAEEITLYNLEGEAVAYTDANDEDLTIYMWNGTPVAYLVPEKGTFNIYGFNGEHLGWFEDGMVRDHEGYIVGFRKGATSIYTKYEHYKAYKKYKPYKNYKKYAPYKPYNKIQFSDESLSLLLQLGKKS